MVIGHAGRDPRNRLRDSDEMVGALLATQTPPMSERPVRESAPPPPKSAGPPFGVLGCLALAVLFGTAIALGVGGEMWSWIVAGVIGVVAGLMLVVHLIKR